MRRPIREGIVKYGQVATGRSAHNKDKVKTAQGGQIVPTKPTSLLLGVHPTWVTHFMAYSCLAALTCGYYTFSFAQYIDLKPKADFCRPVKKMTMIFFANPN